jgi:hypothetical protein
MDTCRKNKKHKRLIGRAKSQTKKRRQRIAQTIDFETDLQRDKDAVVGKRVHADIKPHEENQTSQRIDGTYTWNGTSDAKIGPLCLFCGRTVLKPAIISPCGHIVYFLYYHSFAWNV